MLTNAGERDLRVEELRFTGVGADDFEVDGSDCLGRAIPESGTCGLSVTFRPRSRGDRAAALEVVANVRNSPFALPVAGTAIAPRVGLAPERLDFGAAPVDGEAVSRTLTISNIGELPLELGRVRIAGPNAQEFQRQKRCPSTTLDPGEACSFPVTFAPGVAGERTAELSIQNDSPEGEARIAMVGTGLWEGPVLAVEPADVDFGEHRVGSRSPARSVRFRNPTPGPVNVSAVNLTGDAVFAVDSGTCLNRRLGPGDDCRVDLVFAPGAEKRQRAALELRARESEEAVQVALRGTGVQPRLAVESSSLSFGSTRTGLESASQNAVFSNAGSGTLRLADLELTGAGGDSFRVRKNGCAKKALGPRQKCTVTVSFRPQAVGARQAELKLTPARGIEPVQVSLEGTGIVAGLALDRNRLDFGDVYRTRHEDRKLTLSNAGTARLAVNRLQILGSGADDYRLANVGCSLDQGLAPGRNCVVTVRFLPSANGARSARLVIEHNGPKSPAEIEIRGRGRPPTPAFRASAERFSFGALPQGRPSPIETLTLKNPGAGWMEIRRIVLRGTHAEDFEIVPGTCDGVPALAPGGSCTIGLRFTAKAAGRRTGLLLIEHGAPGSPARIGLSGEGAG